MRKTYVWMAIACLFLTYSFACADDLKWFIIKGKRGICRVISAPDKTPKTIAGPFDTKEEAKKAKDDLCGTKTTKAKKDEGITSTVGKIMKKTAEKAVQRTIYEVIKRYIDDAFK